MPELPEVETLRRGLERSLVGQTLGETRVLVPKMLKGTFSEPGVFRDYLRGVRVNFVGRRGKHLILGLSSGYHLLLHLNMRGQLLVTTQDAPEQKYLAAAFPLSSGLELRFHDMWTWGEMRLLTATERENFSVFAEMGEEPLSGHWTAAHLARRLARRPRTAIKANLLNQAVVAGVGNIYADEALFRAQIQPVRPTGSLTEAETARLHRELQAVLTEATEGGGTTSDNYVDAEGRVGRYTPRVYDRGGQPCVSCGGLLTKIRVTGRGTVFCPSCQF